LAVFNYKIYSRIKKAGVYILLAVISVLVLFPFIYMLSASLSNEENVYKKPPQWIPNPLNINNYIKTWKMLKFPILYLNSFIISAIATIVGVFFDSMAAFVFARREFPGRDIIFIILTSTMMVPFQVIVIPLFLMVKYLGLLDTYVSLFLPWLADAFGIFLIRQYLITIPLDIDDSARIDGCSEFGIYFKIILPLSRPILVSVGIFKFMWVYNNLLWPLIVVSSSNLMTIPVGMQKLLGQQADQRVFVTILMAATAISMMAPIIIYLFAQNQFIKGLTEGAIKG